MAQTGIDFTISLKQADVEEKIELTQNHVEPYLYTKPLEIGAKLGSGAAADVFSCHPQGEPDVIYAVKQLKTTNPTKAFEAKFEFLCEVNFGIHIRNKYPNGCALLTNFVGVIFPKTTSLDGAQYIMEHVKGSSLLGRPNKDEQFTHSQLLKMLCSTAFGIKFIHNEGYYHRDLKLGNLLLNDDFSVKICDFGLIIPRQRQGAFNIGTPKYRAPELHKEVQYSCASDIFSFGLIANLLWTGNHDMFPRGKKDDGARVQNGRLPPISYGEFPPKYRWLKNLIMRCLSRDPAYRPTLDEIINTLMARIQENARQHPEDQFAQSIPNYCQEIITSYPSILTPT